jgi:hypothetical protein
VSGVVSVRVSPSSAQTRHGWTCVDATDTLR